MGYNYYYMHAIRQSKEAETIATYSDLIFDNQRNKQSDYFWGNLASDNHWKYDFTASFCREIFGAGSGNTFYRYLSNTRSENIIVGIRSFGVMHSTVAEYLLKSQKRVNRLEKAIEKVFGFVVEIHPGYNENFRSESSDFPVMPAVTKFRTPPSGVESFDNRYYLDLVFHSSDYVNKKIPATSQLLLILGFLREPSIVKSLVWGRINSLHQLALKYLNLGIKRHNRKDYSYPLWQFAGNRSYIGKEECWNEILKSLAGESNGDGSDKFHMICTGFYILMMEGLKPQELKESMSGPASSMYFSSLSTCQTIADFLAQNYQEEMPLYKSCIDILEGTGYATSGSMPGVRGIIKAFNEKV